MREKFILITYIAIMITILFPLVITNQSKHCTDKTTMADELNERAKSERILFDLAIKGRKTLAAGLNIDQKEKFNEEIHRLQESKKTITDVKISKCLLIG